MPEVEAAKPSAAEQKPPTVLQINELAKFEEGKDSKEWLVPQQSKEVWVNFNGKRWRFVVRPPSWGTLTAIADRAKETDAKTGDVTVNQFKYYRELLKAVIVESPFGLINDVTFSQLSPAAGQVLSSLIETMDLGLGESDRPNVSPSS